MLLAAVYALALTFFNPLWCREIAIAWTALQLLLLTRAAYRMYGDYKKKLNRKRADASTVRDAIRRRIATASAR